MSAHPSQRSGCKHEDFEADVRVDRVADDGTGDDICHFIATVGVRCTECGAAFGFRGPPAGHSWSEPRCTPTAREIHLPLMSPAEMALDGPLPALARGPMVYEGLPSNPVDFTERDAL